MFSRHQNFLPQVPRDYKKPLKALAKFFLIPLKLIPYLIIVFLVIGMMAGISVGLALAPHYASLKMAYGYGASGQAHISAAENLIYSQNFKHAAEELALAENDFGGAAKILKNLENAALFKNRLIKNQLLVAENILSIGQETASAIKSIVIVGQQVVDILHKKNISFADISAAEKAQVLFVIASSTDKFEQAETEFISAGRQLEEINRLHPIFLFDKMVNPLQQKIPKLRKAVASLVTISRILPAFSGYPDAQTYLLIFENNRELRPTGGFIGTYGILKIKNAAIDSIFTDNSYNLDQPAQSYLNIAPPLPIKDYLKQPKWFFRDSNWSPDFPTAAAHMQWFYYQEKGKEKLNGVIAFTPNLIEDLLGYLGAFTVDGLNFTKQNFFDQLEYQVEYGYYKQGIPDSQRKDIIGDLAKQMIAKLYLLPMNQWPDVLDIIAKAMREKQVLVYFNNPDFQALAMAKSWTGEVKQFDGDYFMLVDSNMGALKTDAVMERAINYNLTQTEQNEMMAQVAVDYKNNGLADWKTSRYRTYTRLYAPAGSEIMSIKISGQEVKKEKIDVYDELGKTGFGVFFEVGLRSSQQIIWQYKLPANIAEQVRNGNYSLLAQKQPGVPMINLRLNFNFGGKRSSRAEELRSDQIYTAR